MCDNRGRNWRLLLSEVSQTEKRILCNLTLFHLYVESKSQTQKHNRTVVARVSETRNWGGICQRLHNFSHKVS